MAIEKLLFSANHEAGGCEALFDTRDGGILTVCRGTA